MLDEGEDYLETVQSARLNITRSRAGDRYHCHGCGAEFDRPFEVDLEAVRVVRTEGTGES